MARMTPLRLLLRSLRFYWQTNVAVVLGVVAATAVIGGALIVGDSVRDSLRQMTLDRLGDVDQALVGQRFFTESLAESLRTEAPQGSEVTPAIVLPASATFRGDRSATGEAGETGTLRRAGNVTIYGVDDRFWKLVSAEQNSAPLVINRRLATQLGAEVGKEISFSLDIPSAIPRDALLGDRDETSVELVLPVSAIAEEESVPGRFGLNPTQQLPLNAFVSLDVLQRHLGMGAVSATRRSPVSKPARVNALFTGRAGEARTTSRSMAAILTQQLDQRLTLADLGLSIRRSERATGTYLSIESDRMILEEGFAMAAMGLGPANATSPVLIYLLNEIHNHAAPQKYSMYSVVAGIDFATTPPFGPFEYVAGGAPGPDDGDAVVINEWLAEDLGIEVGGTIDVLYHVVGDRGELPEAAKSFRVAGIAKLTGAADDPGYSPVVPGVTDAESYGDWREPFPLKRDQITKRDDRYWEEHKTTPKVFLPLAAAQSLWQSRYGNLTSVRIAPPQDANLDEFEKQLGQALLDSLEPDETGMTFQEVKEQGLQASEKSGDFTGLFIGFSFFLIVAAALLIGLLFRLGIERRTRELGLLSAVGWVPSLVQRSVILEGCVLTLLGAAIGTGAAIGYAALMIHGLRTWWIGAVGTRFLFLSVHPATLAIGAVIAITVSGLAVLWGLRVAGVLTTREQLAGASEASRSPSRGPRLSRWMAAVGLATAGLLLLLGVTRLLPQSEAFGGFSWQVVAFFLTGISALVGSLSLFAAWLASDKTSAVRGGGLVALLRLGLRNASRHRSRSLLTASLLASAVFVIVAVATGQKDPAAESPKNESGNGGFTLVAETSAPLLYDLNTPQGRAKLGLNVSQAAADESLLSASHFAPFRVKPGEDASCLNIYRTRVPTILGVPKPVLDEFTKTRRFKFADTPSSTPWTLLESDRPQGRIPVIGDMNTLMYSLHKGIGATIALPDDEHPEHQLEVVGMLDGSIFQGVLLMSEDQFLKLFPDQAGFRYFLIECPPGRGEELSGLLESQLAASGFDADRVSDRLAGFLAVQNTYLSTFQTLGGLGLLLGTFGLATVMLRNVLERRGELALMRAVGFEESSVGKLVLIENSCLLLVGIVCGGGAAILSMAPHLLSISATVPWRSLGLLMGMVLGVGIAAAGLAVREAMRTPIVPALRGE